MDIAMANKLRFNTPSIYLILGTIAALLVVPAVFVYKYYHIGWDAFGFVELLSLIPALMLIVLAGYRLSAYFITGIAMLAFFIYSFTVFQIGEYNGRSIMVLPLYTAVIGAYVGFIALYINHWIESGRLNKSSWVCLFAGLALFYITNPPYFQFHGLNPNMFIVHAIAFLPFVILATIALISHSAFYIAAVPTFIFMFWRMYFIASLPHMVNQSAHYGTTSLIAVFIILLFALFALIGKALMNSNQTQIKM